MSANFSRLKRNLFYLLLIFQLFVLPVATNGQSALNLHITTIGAHIGNNPNYRFYKNALDKNGNFVTEPLIMLSYQQFLKNPRNSLEITQGLYLNANARMTGFTYFAFKKKIIHNFKNVVSVSIGPNLTYWKNLHDIYGIYTESTWAHKWLLAAELSYYYYLGVRSDLTTSLHYGLENKTIFWTIGYRFWINPMVHEKKCDCEKSWNFKIKDIPKRIKRIFQ